MKNYYSFTILFIFLLFGYSKKSYSQNLSFYKLTIYHFATEQQEKILDNYLEKAMLPALHKKKYNNVGIFKPIANDTANNKTIYLYINAATINQLINLGDLLYKDNTYNSQAKEHVDAAYNDPPFTRLETILLKAFKLSPAMNIPILKTAKSEHVYELRSYESATEALYKNKVHMFNEGGEIALFNKLGFNAIFYGDVISGSKMPNLIYMTSFENMAARDTHWKTFGDHPEWKQMSTLSKYQHNVSKADIILLHATAYSDF